MAPLYAFLAFGIGSYLSEALSQPAKPKKNTSNLQFPLPDDSAITNGSQRVMKDLAAQVNLLQSRLNDVSEKGKDSLQKQKAAFEQILSHQAHENNMLKNQNHDINGEIQSLRASSAKWRGQAESLALACNKMKHDLQELSANMTLAQEFAHQTLNTSSHMLEAPEVRVLEDLAKEDEVSQKDQLHQAGLASIAGEDDHNLQMLQIDASVAENPQGLLQSLMASIDALSSQQNQSLVKMKANFDMAYQNGLDMHRSLLEKQTKLNATKIYEQNLDDRLHVAVEHLTKTHSELSQKLTALKTFHARLGGENVTFVYKNPAVAVKSHGDKTKMAMLSVESTKPKHEEISARVIEQNGPSQKKHKRTQEKGKTLNHEKEVKLVKHVEQAKQAGPPNTTDQGPAETASEARSDSGAPQWLAPIKWIMR